MLHAWVKNCLKRQWIILLACSWLWSPSSKHPKQYAVKTSEHQVKIWFVENSWMLKNILFSNKLSDVAAWYAFWAASCSSLSKIFSVSSVNKVGSYADMIFSIKLKISPRCRMLCRNWIFFQKKSFVHINLQQINQHQSIHQSQSIDTRVIAVWEHQNISAVSGVDGLAACGKTHPMMCTHTFSSWAKRFRS